MTPVRPGTVWRHTKTGNYYTVRAVEIYVGRHVQEDSEPGDYHAALPSPKATGFPEGTEMVSYVGHYPEARGKTFVRSLAEWLESVEIYSGPRERERAPRFREEKA